MVYFHLTNLLQNALTNIFNYQLAILHSHSKKSIIKVKLIIFQGISAVCVRIDLMRKPTWIFFFFFYHIFSLLIKNHPHYTSRCITHAWITPFFGLGFYRSIQSILPSSAGAAPDRIPLPSLRSSVWDKYSLNEKS